jgi:selenocysteine lyase/cysteine desulfurase
MDRRQFLATGVGAAVGAPLALDGGGSATAAGRAGARQTPVEIRELFPRLRGEVFLNAAGGTPLGSFAREGLRRYEDFWTHGPGEGRADYFAEMLTGVRGRIAGLIGADSSEVALVHCTKEGEQIVLDGLPSLRSGGNVVTNDLHFAGSLHNMLGLRKAGMDVRIVRSQNFDLDLDQMADAIDDRTALVSVTLVSNINGRIEPIMELAALAHAHGAYVYADIIQAAGIVPFDVHDLGIDFAAGNGYKWLFGPHGTGFLFVRRELQGSALSDRLFPGHARHNYRPWVAEPAAGQPDYVVQDRGDARRYEPGHHAYLCYAALYEGLGFVEEMGVEAMRDHTVGLAGRLADRLDPDIYPCVSPHTDRSPIVAFTTGRPPEHLAERLSAERIAVALSPGRIRVSPAIFNTADDIDLLAEVLNRA